MIIGHVRITLREYLREDGLSRTVERKVDEFTSEAFHQDTDEDVMRVVREWVTVQ